MRSYFFNSGRDSNKTLVYLSSEERVAESRKAQCDASTKIALKRPPRKTLLKAAILQEKVDKQKAKIAANKKLAKERAEREFAEAEAAAIEETKKANLLSKQVIHPHGLNFMRSSLRSQINNFRGS